MEKIKKLALVWGAGFLEFIIHQPFFATSQFSNKAA